MDSPPLLDHVGWRLWEACRLWESRFEREMAAAGHAWFSEARASLVPHIARDGTRQAELVQRTGLSKQAVQQLVDALVADGIVERRPDPDDARARLVIFTRRGLRVLADANDAKARIEREYERRLGRSTFDALKHALEEVVRLRVPDAER